jgi:two-component system, LytTR family, sensor kinase
VTKTAWMPRWRWVLLVATGLALSSTLQASRMMALADRPPAVIPVGRLLALNLTLWLAPAVLTPTVFRLVDWLSFRNAGLARSLTFHAIAATAFSILHSTALFLVYASFWWINGRLAKFQWLSAAQSEYANNFNFSVVTYGSIAALGYALEFRHRVHQRALEVAKLETQLAEERLGSLAGELQPEFLYASLDAVSGFVRTNPDRADRIISKLADFLRLVLNRSGTIVGPLQDELECVERYIEIEQVRQDTGLSVTLDIDPDTLDAEFPPMTLHSLVDIVLDQPASGLQPRNTALSIESSHDDASLYIRVKSMFDGSRASEVGSPARIEAVRDRLHALYGKRQDVGVKLDEQTSTAWLTVPYRAAMAATSVSVG